MSPVQISPKAVVANPAGLAVDVQVGPFSLLGPDVTVGAGTVIANNVTILGKTRIGANCRIFPGAVIGCVPPEQEDPDAIGACTIDDNNTIREHVIIEAGLDAGGTIIGPGSLLMVGCQVGHDAHVEGRCIFVNFTRIEHHAHLELFVQTSAFANISAYATVGAYTYTNGYAGIDRDVPPYVIVHGCPYRVRNINVEKLRRCGVDAGSITKLREAYRLLFNGEALPSGEALQAVASRFDDEHVRRLTDSLRRIAASPSGKVRLDSRGQG